MRAREHVDEHRRLAARCDLHEERGARERLHDVCADQLIILEL
jgi:hypothetical protein